MTSDYDVIIIGAGAPGEHCAGALAEGGLKVAVVEREVVGGECTYWACIPSKTLLRPGEALQAAREAPGAREAINGGLEVEQALAWRDYMVSNYDDSAAARWLDVWTNREATGLKEVPERLLVLGGGPVGVEMAQAVRRMGASVALVEGAEHVLPREPSALGEALGDALSGEGVELHLGQHASEARRDGHDYVLAFSDGRELRGAKLLVATGRRPRTEGIGLETVGVEPGPHGIEVDARMAAGDGLWAIGDVTGIWPLTHVGKYQGRVAAANILGESRAASYDAVPRVVFTDPQAAAVGETEGPLSATVAVGEVPRAATYTRNYDERPGFLTLVSDGERLTGAYALGPEAGEWLQQATLAIRAQVPLEILADTIQPFPTFSEIFLNALTVLGQTTPARAR